MTQQPRRLRRAAGPALAVSLLVLTTGGCASALKPLETDSDLARVDPEGADAVEAERLAAQAKRLYDLRPDLEAVRSAEDLWRRAALTDTARAFGVIGLSQAQTWLARHLATPEERDDKATEAVRTAQWCAEREPDNLDCPYWLALAVGVQAEQRRSTAVDGLQVMIDLLHQAIEGHEVLDHAGPQRVLAMVLVRAPGWPTGPGDPDQGLVHARRAVEIGPEYPPNLLALADASAEVEDSSAARRYYDEALAAARAWLERGHPDAGEWIEEAQDGLGDRPAGR